MIPARGGINIAAMPPKGNGTRNGLFSVKGNVWQRQLKLEDEIQRLDHTGF